MCIVAHEADLADTKIFTCVSATKDGQPTRQFTIYQNNVKITNTAFKQNFMCLPIPLKTGLIPKEHIFLYDFGANVKSNLKVEYEGFFQTLQGLFEKDTRNSWGFLSDNRDDDDEEHLEVVRVGDYLCSLAASPADVLRLDESVFGKPVGLREVLERGYMMDFAFLICSFSQTSRKSFTPHPIAYSHPVAENGSLFIPTKHYHGGEPNHKYVDDWSHHIYVFDGQNSDIHAQLHNAKYKKEFKTEAYIEDGTNVAMKESSLMKVLSDAFSQHNNVDSVTRNFMNDKTCGSQITIHGRFDNVDLQPKFVVIDKDDESFSLSARKNKKVKV